MYQYNSTGDGNQRTDRHITAVSPSVTAAVRHVTTTTTTTGIRSSYRSNQVKVLVIVALVQLILLMSTTSTSVGVVLAATASSSSSSIKLISRHQPSITKVLRDIQKHQQQETDNDDDDTNSNEIQLVSSTFIASRSVTQQQQRRIVNEILQTSAHDTDTHTDTDTDDVLGDSTSTTTTYNAVATSTGTIVLLQQPQQPVSLLSSNNNHIHHNGESWVYYPDPMDLYRGEGLTDQLGPLLESILQQQQRKPDTATMKEEDDTMGESINEKNAQQPLPSTTEPQQQRLYVIVPDWMEASFVQTQLERSIQSLLPYFIINNQMTSTTTTATATTMTIRDHIRPIIIYTSSKSAVMDLLLHNDSTKSATTTTTTTLSQLLLRQRRRSRRRPTTTTTTMDVQLQQTQQYPLNIAASNRLRPVAQQQYNNIIAALERSCISTELPVDSDNNNNNKKGIKFVPNFGELCDAIITKEMGFWYDRHNNNNGEKSTIAFDMVRKSMIGRQIRDQLYEDVFMYIVTNLYSEQIQLLQKQSFDAMKKDLSKLVVSPNLQTDMNRIGQASISTFVTATVRLIPKTSFPTTSTSSSSSHHTSYLTSVATCSQQIYIRKVLEYIKNRMLIAKASGKFRPIPRKGFTVGLHYLMPKPFGNDYRQEPSMVHATDQMVYIPKQSKLSDVNLQQQQQQPGNSDEWKNSIVPHPPGNDMLYMQ